MNKKLVAALREITDLDYRQLKMRMEIADSVKSMMRNFCKDNKFMQKELGLSAKSFKNFLNAAYEIDLRLISKIQCLHQRLGEEKDKADGKYDVISFPPYKYSKDIIKTEGNERTTS